MGDKFRSDSDKSKTTAPDKDDDSLRADKRARQDEGFDGSHGKLAAGKTAIEPQGNAENSVEGQNGRPDQIAARFSDAIMRSDRAAAMAAVMDMSTPQREKLTDGDVAAIAAIGTPRDVMIISDFAKTSATVALRAVLAAQPRISAHDLRGYLADGAYSHQLIDTETVTALRKLAAGPLDLFSELDDLLPSKALLEWYLAVTPSKEVARDMLAATTTEVISARARHLTAFGPAAWAWLETLDATMADRAAPGVLSAYRAGFDEKNPAPASLTAGITESEKHEAEGKAAKDKEHRAIAAQRPTIVRTKPALEIVEAARGAGLDFDGQLDWLLDKPALTAAEFHRATANMVTSAGKDGMSDATVFKLVAKFPTTSVTELFGDLPEELADTGAAYPAKLARWLLHGAAPETILRIVASSPNNVERWCGILVQLGIGYGWLHQLGGRSNDQFLRRFALQCPDKDQVKYVEERLLGAGAHDSTEQTKGADFHGATYARATVHFETDLDNATRKGPQTDEQRDTKSEAVAEDLVEFTPLELDKLSRDPAKLERVLATADKATFVRLLDLVHVDLSVAMRHADASKITGPHLLSWSQARPASEIGAFLRDESLVENYTALVDHGLLDCFPAAGPVLAPALARKSIVTWLLKSDPTTVLHGLASSVAAIDAAAHAFAPLAQRFEDWMPPAVALDAVGQGTLRQLAARAHGELRTVLDRKLAAKMPDDDADGDTQNIAANAASTHDAKTAPLEAAVQIVQRYGDASTLRAFFRTHALAWNTMEEAKLALFIPVFADVSPDVATGRPLGEFLENPGAWRWAISTTAPHRILDALAPASYPVAASLLGEVAREFFLNLPRGRLLTAAHKEKLHAIAREDATSDYMKSKLFEIAFDVPLDSPKDTKDEDKAPARTRFDGAEIEKIWSALEKVPHAHVDQHSIRNFISVTKAPSDGTLGMYDPKNREISIDKSSTTETQKLYDHQANMTEEQAIAAVGSREEFERFRDHDPKRIKKNDDGTYSFEQVEVNQFSQTVLHEVGHSVDAMLGNQSKLVYELAGWKRFGLDMFEHWAASLGGWETVTGEDQKEIARAWKSWLAGGSKGKVADLVPSTHAAVKTDYASVGVVQLASNTQLHEGTELNGQYVKVRTMELYTLAQRGLDATPTEYALTTPEEYFAECYAAYYGKYVETGGKAAKGENVMPWIKTWMDKNVDTVAHNPMASHFPRSTS